MRKEKCRQCGKVFSPKREWSRYCSRSCGDLFRVHSFRKKKGTK